MVAPAGMVGIEFGLAGLPQVDDKETPEEFALIQ